MRYEVRERNARYGVWDSYLLRWMENALGQDEMDETDAEVLAGDLK